MLQLPTSISISRINGYDVASNNERKNRFRYSLGNVFNHIWLERKFELDIVSFSEAVALDINQGFVAC